MKPPAARRLVGALAPLAALQMLGANVYLPALPMIGAFFAVEIQVIEASLSLFLLGAGAGQLVGAPLSNRYGRRPMALAGVVGFAPPWGGSGWSIRLPGVDAPRAVPVASLSGTVRRLRDDRPACRAAEFLRTGDIASAGPARRISRVRRIRDSRP